MQILQFQSVFSQIQPSKWRKMNVLLYNVSRYQHEGHKKDSSWCESYYLYLIFLVWKPGYFHKCCTIFQHSNEENYMFHSIQLFPLIFSTPSSSSYMICLLPSPSSYLSYLIYPPFVSFTKNSGFPDTFYWHFPTIPIF